MVGVTAYQLDTFGLPLRPVDECPRCGHTLENCEAATSATVSLSSRCSRDEQWAYRQLYGDLFNDVEHYRDEITVKIY